jgi:DnaJ-class molecular chaperone
MNPYEVLGLKKESNPSKNEIRKAYYKLAKKYHPDKSETADEDKFKEVSKAYEILSDPEKKQRYDRFGVVDEQSGGHHVDPMEMFKEIFGGGASPFGMNFNNGGSFHFMGRMPRRNSGFSFPGAGMGLPPGTRININGKNCIIGQNGQPIEKANDIIENIPLTFSDLWNGKKITVRNKFKVTIEKGVLFGKKFTFKGKGEKADGKESGDLIINIVPDRKDELSGVFNLKRDGSLIYKKNINILDSLTGLSFRIPHPSGETIVIKQNNIIKYNEPYVIIKDKGMPIYGEDNKYADLIIHYNITYDNIQTDVISRLKKIYPQQILNVKPTEPLFEF